MLEPPVCSTSPITSDDSCGARHSAVGFGMWLLIDAIALRSRHLPRGGLSTADEVSMIDWLGDAITEIIEIGCVYLLVLGFSSGCRLAVVVGLAVYGLVRWNRRSKDVV